MYNIQLKQVINDKRLETNYLCAKFNMKILWLCCDLVFWPDHKVKLIFLDFFTKLFTISPRLFVYWSDSKSIDVFTMKYECYCTSLDINGILFPRKIDWILYQLGWCSSIKSSFCIIRFLSLTISKLGLRKSKRNFKNDKVMKYISLTIPNRQYYLF